MKIQYPKLHYRHTLVCNFDQSEDNALWYKRVGLGGDAPVQITDDFMYITSNCFIKGSRFVWTRN